MLYPAELSGQGTNGTAPALVSHPKRRGKSACNGRSLSWATLFRLNEKQSVTAEMAVRFGKLFGNGACFWVNL